MYNNMAWTLGYLSYQKSVVYGKFDIAVVYLESAIVLQKWDRMGSYLFPLCLGNKVIIEYFFSLQHATGSFS